MIYKICIEDKNLNKVKDLCSICFDNFTVYYTEKYWKGKREKNIVIEINTEKDYELIEAIARKIKSLNGQEAILITWSIEDSKLV